MSENWIVVRLNDGSSAKKEFLDNSVQLIKQHIEAGLTPVVVCPCPKDILVILLDILTVTSSRNYHELIQEVQRQFYRLCDETQVDANDIQSELDQIVTHLNNAHTVQMTGFQMAKNDAMVVGLSQILISKIVHRFLVQNGIPTR